MKSFYIVLFLISINFLHSQNILTLKNDYIVKTVLKNESKNLIFYNSYSKVENEKYLKLIKTKLTDSIIVSEIINLPISLSNKCNEKALKANIFIIKVESSNGKVFKEIYGYGEFTPNKATLTYKWKFIDNFLYFIFTDLPLEDDLQQMIYIPDNSMKPD